MTLVLCGIAKGAASVLNQLKIANIRNLLLCLLEKKRATKQAMGQITHLSNTTVSDSVNSMLKLGLVVTAGNEDSIGGRRSTIYTINKQYGQFLGLYLGAHTLCCVVTDPLGALLAIKAFTRREDELPIQLLYRAIEEMRHSDTASHLLAIGVGLEGKMDYENQIVLESALLEWKNVHLKELVERQFYIPTFVDSAINGQVFFERYIHQDTCPQNLMILCEDFSSKAALCIDGNICRGPGNLCGNIHDIEQTVKHADTWAQTLDIPQLVISFRTASYEALIPTNPEREVELITRACDESTLPQGMALLAETLWFESIYFLLQ